MGLRLGNIVISLGLIAIALYLGLTAVLGLTSVLTLPAGDPPPPTDGFAITAISGITGIAALFSAIGVLARRRWGLTAFRVMVAGMLVFVALALWHNTGNAWLIWPELLSYGLLGGLTALLVDRYLARQV